VTAGSVAPLRRSTIIWTLASILVLFVLAALFTPQPVEQGRSGDARLTTLRANAQGARLLYELADRLGWRVARRTQAALPDAPAGRTIHAVLAPAVTMTARETHELLERVRGGDALLYVLSPDGAALSDSLRLVVGTSGELVVPPHVAAGAPACGPGHDGAVPLWYDWRAHLLRLRWTAPAPVVDEVFAQVRPDRMPANARLESLPPTALGFRLGRGRVAVVADPDLLRNDVLRVCHWRADLVAVRMLEYLSHTDGGASRDLVLFDEYHQGNGAQPGTMRAIARYLSRTASGNLVAQLVLAGLLWLLAAAPRDVVPHDPERIERRSPLEHVSALAHAYDQVNASRTAAARLLRGVRRRAERASRAAALQTDDAFLDWVQRRAPALGGDVALVRRALATTVPRRELPELSAALRRIEASLATTIR